MIIDNSLEIKKDKPLVLLLDEADKLVPIDRKEGWRIINNLRALTISGYAQIIFSGELLLRESLQDQSSPMYNFSTEILLRPLDYHSVKELVTRPIKILKIQFEDENAIVKRIYDFTFGHPNIVQRLCIRLLEFLNLKGARIISLCDLDEIINNPDFQQKDFLQIYWDRSTPLEKIISLILSKNDKSYKLPEVHQLLSDVTKSILPKGEVKDALDRLVDLRSILKLTQQGFEYAVKSFPEVIANSVVFDDQLETLIEEYNNSQGGI
jgi:hypothetical protein